MRKSEQTDKIVPELIKIQMALETVPKKGRNKFYDNSRYVILEDALAESVPKLNEAGIFLTQTVDQNCLLTTLLHTSGQWIESAIPLINKKGDDQGQGGSITYAKRYGLLSILGIPTEDDDGNIASQTTYNEKLKKHPEPIKPQSAFVKALPKELPNRAPGAATINKTEAASAIMANMKPQTNKWADYTLKTGKTKGQTIKQIGVDGAFRYREWLEEKEQTSDKPLRGDAVADLNALRAFQQECADANPAKVWRGNETPPTIEYESPTWKDEDMPKFDSDEKIPF